jgi:hypothetical protein
MRFLRIVPLILGLATIAKADLILHYTGGQLTPCVDGTGCQVSIDLGLFSPLPANFSATYTDASFHQFIEPTVLASDGLHTLNDSWGTNATGFVRTDAAGNLSDWGLLFEGGIGGGIGGTLRFETIQIGPGGSSVDIIGGGMDRQEFFAGPGTWEVTPEPSSALFLGTVIFCVVLMCRGRMSSTQP